MRMVLRVLGGLIVAAIVWVVLGYVATLPLGAVYGWGGHPAIPAAPMWVYVVLYLVVLPVISLIIGWMAVRRIGGRGASASS